MGYFCNECNKLITDKEYVYSKNNYERALCRLHQKNLNKKEHESNSYNKTSKIKNSTKEAKMLGEILNELGWKVEYEKWDGYKHIDIAIVDAKVNLEVDGSQHNLDVNQALADLQRTFHSFRKGYVTLRIPNCLVRDKNAINTTAIFVNRFLNKSVEMLNEEVKEAENSGGILNQISNISEMLGFKKLSLFN